jgi:hypothetical protein
MLPLLGSIFSIMQHLDYNNGRDMDHEERFVSEMRFGA